jgi:signal transduction histidine kinase
MPLVESVLAPLRDSQLAAKLAAQATSPSPAWLWSTDGSRIVWANAVGAAVFGAADAGECEKRRFGAKDAAAAQIVRLAATLPTSGQPRLERLRGFGADFGRALTSMCSRVALADGTPAVLIIATEPAGPPLTLGERVRRLFADRRRALAAFAREGTLLYATEPALTRFVGTATLSMLGVDGVAAPALVNGSASGATPYGPVTVERLGSDASTVLVLLFDARAGESVAEPTGAETTAPAPAPASSFAEPPPSAPLERAPAAVAPTPVIAAVPPTTSSVPEPLVVAPAPAAPADGAAATQASAVAPEQSAGAPEPASPSAQAPAAAPLPPAAAEADANGAAAAQPTAAPEPPSAPVQPHAAASPPAAPAQVPANGAGTAEPAASVPQPNSAHAHAHAADAQIERRHPLRFVWQMDADGRFAIGSDEFIELMGPRTTASFGRLWSEIAAELNLDPDQQVARAVATHETWSSITLSWPVDESRERLSVELSGLPVFDRNRNFRGYRGFGVLRDITRTNQLARARRERPMGFGAQPEAPVEAARAVASPAAEHAAPADTQAAAAAPGVFAAPEPPVATASAPSAVAPVPSGIAPRAEPRAAEAAAANVVPFRAGAPTDAKAPSLSVVERKAFRELAQELSARLGSGSEIENSEDAADALAAEEQKTPAGAAEAQATSPDQSATPSAVAAPAAEAAPSEPVAASAPGIAPSAESAQAPQENAAPRSDAEAVQQPASPAFEPVLLDRLPVGVLLYQDATLLYANRRFLEWSGHESLGALAAAGGLNTLFAAPGAVALAPTGAAQSLSLTTASGERMAVEGRLFTVPWGDGSALALVLTSAEIEQERRAIAAALDSAEGQIRDLKARLQSLDKTEDELRTAKREAHKAATEKADFLAKVSHEIRTPLNAITGFAEVIMAERFGPIGNERYRDYLKDIHVAGTHLVSLLNDLLDLSKIETGQLDLTFVSVGLNEITQQCVGIMQPQASRARIIIRTSLTPGLPQIMADERSLRQIVLNLLANSIKFTGPGGQVIVSTACADSGEIVLRVRDTGVGMSAKDVEAAMEPFRQTATSGSWGSGGNGFGLPLTKALAEANRAHFNIKSAPNAGTLVEIAFPRPTAP